MIEIKTEVVLGLSALAEIVQKYRNEKWQLIGFTAVAGAGAGNPALVGGKETEYTVVFEKQSRATADA